MLIGSETYRRLPDGAVVDPMPGLKVKGKDDPIDGYVLRSLPGERPGRVSSTAPHVGGVAVRRAAGQLNEQ